MIPPEAVNRRRKSSDSLRAVQARTINQAKQILELLRGDKGQGPPIPT